MQTARGGKQAGRNGSQRPDFGYDKIISTMETLHSPPARAALVKLLPTCWSYEGTPRHARAPHRQVDLPSTPPVRVLHPRLQSC